MTPDEERRHPHLRQLDRTMSERYGFQTRIPWDVVLIVASAYAVRYLPRLAYELGRAKGSAERRILDAIEIREIIIDATSGESE